MAALQKIWEICKLIEEKIQKYNILLNAEIRKDYFGFKLKVHEYIFCCLCVHIFHHTEMHTKIDFLHGLEVV